MVLFQLSNNKDARSAYGSKTVSTFTSSVGGTGANYAGTTLKLTAVINSDQAASESNAANDTASISIAVPAGTPPTTPTTINC